MQWLISSCQLTCNEKKLVKDKHRSIKQGKEYFYTFEICELNGNLATEVNPEQRKSDPYHRRLYVTYLLIDFLEIQWGSEYQTSWVDKWSKRGWMQNGPVFKRHLNTVQTDE